jgi:hypothetical protein
VLIIHVPENASASEYQEARATLQLALSVVGGESVQSSPTSSSDRVVNVKPASAPKGVPAKGSDEAKARMAKARAGKQAAKGTSSAPKASDRLAELAAKAGIAATPEPAKAAKASKPSSERYALPEFVAQTTDADFDTLEAFASRLVDDRKLAAMVLYLQGKASASELDAIASRTGTLKTHAERVVVRARRGEDS